MTDKLLQPIESAINFALGLDSDSQNKLAVLEGYLFELDCQSPQFSVFAVIEKQDETIRVKLHRTAERQADVTLSGTAAAFINMLQQGVGMNSVSRSGIRISGDVEAGQRIGRIAQNLDLDWEGLIAEYIGDLPARKIGNFIRSAFDWAKQTQQYGQENMRDYLAEEKKWIIPKAEFEAYEDRVDALRSDVDRLEARLKALMPKR